MLKRLVLAVVVCVFCLAPIMGAGMTAVQRAEIEKALLASDQSAESKKAIVEQAGFTIEEFEASKAVDDQAVTADTKAVAEQPKARRGSLEDGLVVMVIGMSVTFLFLTIMVICMYGLHSFLVFLNRFFPEKTEHHVAATPAVAAARNEEIALAIAIASARMKN